MNPASAATAGCILIAGQRRWRVAASDVLDVIPWPKVTAVPLQPRDSHPELLGVFEWNNTVVPVFEIAGLAGHERRRVVIVRATVNGTATPVGLASTDVGTADESATAELLAIADLTARLPKFRR